MQLKQHLIFSTTETEYLLAYLQLGDYVNEFICDVCVPYKYGLFCWFSPLGDMKHLPMDLGHRGVPAAGKKDRVSDTVAEAGHVQPWNFLV